jgi:hypothetical protein
MKSLDRDTQIMFLQQLDPLVSLHAIDWIFSCRCSYPKGVKNLSQSCPGMKKLIEYHSKARLLDDIYGKGTETVSSFGYYFTLWFTYLENLLKADFNSQFDSVKVRKVITEMCGRYTRFGNKSDIITMDVYDKLLLMF